MYNSLTNIKTISVCGVLRRNYFLWVLDFSGSGTKPSYRFSKVREESEAIT
jgi:hypothetical protein